MQCHELLSRLQRQDENAQVTRAVRSVFPLAGIGVFVPAGIDRKAPNVAWTVIGFHGIPPNRDGHAAGERTEFRLGLLGSGRGRSSGCGRRHFWTPSERTDSHWHFPRWETTNADS